MSSSPQVQKDLERERIWILRFKKNPEEYARIVREFSPGVSGYLLRRTGDPQVAEELTQDTFVEAFNGVLKFEWRGISLAGFLFKIARNVYSAWYKRGLRQREFSLDPGKMEIESGASADQDLLRAEEMDLLFSCLAQLKEIEREVIDLYFWGGLTTREIAIILKMKEPTIQSHLLRGKRGLLKHLTEMGLDKESFYQVMHAADKAPMRENLFKKWGGEGGEPAMG